jgi:hemerythrin superfamily protein
MVTRTSTRSSTSRSRRSSDRVRASAGNGSAFRWGSAGAIAGAALGGAAFAIAANLGRKFVTQGISAKGSWDESLAAEHDAALAIFDKMLATDETQTVQRRLLFMKLSHALDRHTYAEEHVVYPALREANDEADAAELETEHGEVKEYLYRLQHMEFNAPNWLETVREFRQAIEAHAQMEEEQIFPRLRSEISDELDQRITKEVNKAGFMMA